MSGGWMRLLGWARRIFGEDAARRVFEPLLADWQHDATAAASAPRRVLAHLRGGCAAACSALLVSGRLALAWRAQGPLPRQVATTAAASALAGSALVLLLAALPGWQELTWPVMLALLTDVAKMTLPMALAPSAVVLARAGHVSRSARRRLACHVTAAAVGVQLAMAGWVAPAAARLERELRNRSIPEFAAIPPSAHVLSLDELLRREPSAATRVVSPFARREEVWNRVSWLTWPIAIVFMGWQVGARLAHRRLLVLGAIAWSLSLAAFLTPMLLVWWVIVGGPFGTATLAVKFLPSELLAGLGLLLWLTSRSDAHTLTSRQPATEA